MRRLLALSLLFLSSNLIAYEIIPVRGLIPPSIFQLDDLFSTSIGEVGEIEVDSSIDVFIRAAEGAHAIASKLSDDTYFVTYAMINEEGIVTSQVIHDVRDNTFSSKGGGMTYDDWENS